MAHAVIEWVRRTECIHPDCRETERFGFRCPLHDRRAGDDPWF